MINLFKTIYARPDNNVAALEGQKRIILSDRTFSHPFPKDETELQKMGVLDFLPTMADVEKKYESLDGFWSMLMLSKERTLIIAGQEQLVTLLISYWKSIFTKPTAAALYKLYQFTIFNENLLYVNITRDNPDRAGLQDNTELEPVSQGVFNALYSKIQASDVLRSLTNEEVPVEYLLAAYFSGTANQNATRMMQRKVKRIVFTNLVGILSNDRAHFINQSHNHYLLSGGSDSADILNPLETLRADPSLAWLFDEAFSPKTAYEELLKKYPPAKLKEIFGQYNTLLVKGKRFYEAEAAVDFLIANDINGLLAYDVEDENANFFTEREYFKKVNTLLVSYFYQLTRRGLQEELKAYTLAI